MKLKILKIISVLLSSMLLLSACTAKAEEEKIIDKNINEKSLEERLTSIKFDLSSIDTYTILEVTDRYVYYVPSTNHWQESVRRIDASGNDEEIISEEELKNKTITDFREYEDGYLYLYYENSLPDGLEDYRFHLIIKSGDQIETLFTTNQSLGTKGPTLYNLNDSLYLLGEEEISENDYYKVRFYIYDIEKKQRVYESDYEKETDKYMVCTIEGRTVVNGDTLFINFNENTYKFKDNKVEQLFDFQVSNILDINDHYIYLPINSYGNTLNLDILAEELPLQVLDKNEELSQLPLSIFNFDVLAIKKDRALILVSNQDGYFTYSLTEVNGEIVTNKIDLDIPLDYVTLTTNGVFTSIYDAEISRYNEITYIYIK